MVEVVPSGYIATSPKPTTYYTDVITSGLAIGNNDFENRKIGKPLQALINFIETHFNTDSHGQKADAKGQDKKK